MSNNRNYMDEDKLSFKAMVHQIRDWLLFLWKKWPTLAIGTLLFTFLWVAYHVLKPPKYNAQTSFVLESSGESLGQLSSLASLAGINLGVLSENSDLFQIDNIMELYRSHRMLRKTLLTMVETEGAEERLIDRYARKRKLRSKWERKHYLRGISFDIPPEEFTVRHDSLLIEIADEIREDHLSVTKPNRKLSILHVAINSKDELFAKRFNEALVANVNQFYRETKVKKTGENLRVLQFQTDSVKEVLDRSIEQLARLSENNPNPNPLLMTAQVPFQKLQIAIRTSAVAYEEMIKNLELTRIAHRNNTPLIQIIDYPILPLPDDKMKWGKAIALGLLLGALILVVFLTVGRIIRIAMHEETP